MTRLTSFILFFFLLHFVAYNAEAEPSSNSTREVRALKGHTDDVMSVAFSPDGRYLASGSHDKTLRLWDTKTGREVRVFLGHTGSVYSVAFSSDGRYVASGNWDRTIRIWDTATGRKVRELLGHTSGVYCVAFSRDGRSIVSASLDDTIRIWDTATGKLLRLLPGHEHGVHSVSFSPDGRLIVSGGNDKTVRIWDTETGKEVRVLRGHSNTVSEVAFSPDGRFIVSASYDKTIRIWDTETEKVLVLTGHTNAVNAVSFSTDGKHLVSGSQDLTVRLWDQAKGEQTRVFVGHSELVSSVAFSPEGSIIASGGFDKTIRLRTIEIPPEGLKVNAIILKGPINVRSRLPTLKSKGFLKWEWDFGETIDVLSTDFKVRILSTTTIDKVHLWALIRYKKENAVKEGYVYMAIKGGERFLEYLNSKSGNIHSEPSSQYQSRGKPSEPNQLFFIGLAFAEGIKAEEASPEEQYMRKSVNFTWDALILTCILVLIGFIVFKWFPIEKEFYKFNVFLIIIVATLLIWGLIRGDQFMTVVRSLSGGN